MKAHQGDLEYLKYAKDYGFSDKVIAHRFDMTEEDVYQLKLKQYYASIQNGGYLCC